MRAVCDTGPLLAAADKREAGHGLAALVVAELGRDLLIPDTVLVETDYLLRSRLGSPVARAFLRSVAMGEFSAVFLAPGLLSRAVEIDARYGDLDLGLTDTSVMAYAERHDLPILTFDFAHFRAAPPERGEWRLVIEERHYAAATR